MPNLREIVEDSLADADRQLAEHIVLNAYFAGKYIAPEPKRVRKSLRWDDVVDDLESLPPSDDIDRAIIEQEIERVRAEVSLLLGVCETALIKSTVDGEFGRFDEVIAHKIQSLVDCEYVIVKNKAILKSILCEDGVYSGVGGSGALVSIMSPDLRDSTGNPLVYAAEKVANDLGTLSKGVVVFIPPGYMWVGGKLTQVSDALTKAMPPPHDPGGRGRVGAPPPLSRAGRKFIAEKRRAGLGATPPSLPGVASPGQTGNVVGQPKVGGAAGSPSAAMPASAPSGPAVPVWYLPKDKAATRPLNAHHETDKSWAIPVGMPARMADGTEFNEGDSGGSASAAGTEQDSGQPHAQPPAPTTPAEAKQYGSVDKPPEVVADHLANGAITHSEPLSEDVKGISDSFRVTVQGNGRGVMKPPASYPDHAYTNKGYGAGATTCLPGTAHKREAAAYSLAIALGQPNLVPPTVVRSLKQGEFNQKAAAPDKEVEVSVQSWYEGYPPVPVAITKATGVDVGDDDDKNYYQMMMSLAPEDKKEELQEKVDTAIVFQLIQNNNDFHHFNMVVSADMSDVALIDNSWTNGYGFESCRNEWLRMKARAGERLVIPPALFERMDNITFTDLKRDLGDYLHEDDIAHTFLRIKYLVHLQESEGFINHQRFRTIIEGGAGMMIPSVQGMSRNWHPEGEFMPSMRLVGEKMSPNAMFESFAKWWIEKNAGKKIFKTRFTADAKAIKDLQVFKPLSFYQMKKDGTFNTHEEFKATGEAAKKYDSIQAYDPVKKFPYDKLTEVGGDIFGKDEGAKPMTGLPEFVSEQQKYAESRRKNPAFQHVRNYMPQILALLDAKASSAHTQATAQSPTPAPVLVANPAPPPAPPAPPPPPPPAPKRAAKPPPPPPPAPKRAAKPPPPPAPPPAPKRAAKPTPPPPPTPKRAAKPQGPPPVPVTARKPSTLKKSIQDTVKDKLMKSAMTGTKEITSLDDIEWDDDLITEKNLREYLEYEIIDYTTDEPMGVLWYLDGEVCSQPENLKYFCQQLLDADMSNPENHATIKDGRKFLVSLGRVRSTRVGVKKVHGNEEL